MALGELGVGKLRATVGDLHRTEELLLQSVGVPGVQILVGLGQARERKPEFVRRLGQRVEQLLPASDAEYAISGQSVGRMPSKTTSSESRTLSAPISPR